MLKDDENQNRKQALKIYNDAKIRSKGRKKYAVTSDGKPVLPEKTNSFKHLRNK